MTVGIHQIDSGSSGYENSAAVHSDDSKNKAIVRTEVSDIEADAYFENGAQVEEKKGLVYRAEKTEITPVEAFKWNVDGDQSPCESSTTQPK